MHNQHTSSLGWPGLLSRVAAMHVIDPPENVRVCVPAYVRPHNQPGGETVFPNAEPSVHVKGPGWSECALKGLAHKPVKGDALLFYRWGLCSSVSLSSVKGWSRGFIQSSGHILSGGSDCLTHTHTHTHTCLPGLMPAHQQRDAASPLKAWRTRSRCTAAAQLPRARSGRPPSEGLQRLWGYCWACVVKGET
jgi:hypothetical protein